MGYVLLVGLVVKNGIVLLEVARSIDSSARSSGGGGGGRGVVIVRTRCRWRHDRFLRGRSS